MSPLRSDRIRPWMIIAGLLLAWLILPVFLKSLLRSGIYEFQAPLWSATSHVDDIQTYWANRIVSKNTLIEENKELLRRLNYLELKVLENQRLEGDVRRLEELLGIEPIEDFEYVVARVVRRRSSAWWEQLVIRKGYLHGIAVGDPVIFSEGLLGKVSEVHAHLSTVDLITHPEFRFSASLTDDIRPLEYSALANPFPGQAEGTIRFIPPDMNWPTGEERLIITSGLGGQFPRGIPVGIMSSVELSGDGLYQRGRIQLSPSLNMVREVAVMVPIQRLQDDALAP